MYNFLHYRNFYRKYQISINLEKNYQNKLNDELEKRDSVHKIEIQREHQIIELQHKEQIKLLNDQIETQRMDIELKDKENKRLQQEHHEKNQTLRTTESELQLQITSLQQRFETTVQHHAVELKEKDLVFFD